MSESSVGTRAAGPPVKRQGVNPMLETVSNNQIERIVTRMLPGARVRDAAPLGARSLLVTLSDRQIVLRLPAGFDRWAGEALRAEELALRALQAEIDLPLPSVVGAAEASGDDPPALALSYLAGTPLPEVIAAIDEESRFAIGQALAHVMARVHSYLAPHYGQLRAEALPAPAAQPAMPGADVAYLRERVATTAAEAVARGQLNPEQSDWLQRRLADWVTTTGRPACLVHGDLHPRRIIVRRRERDWRLVGVVGWGFAQTWRPAWDHAALYLNFAEPDYFGLRVGYGAAYDETTDRRYDQVREFALLPYRLALLLEREQADLALAIADQLGNVHAPPVIATPDEPMNGVHRDE
ncbi:aminoglycoside phosphotransferase family protein [Chloroflexus sp.]|uniref:phosphotransferase family protein n=1 Tax=Chloroflexus sp. TaxID=1904827 RepID=UPI00298F1595|nr:aminoglycoside phosphotransferase family protein [Chloroflexus sp.]MCS6888294.1 aminoglycoside phosphotransferase family protein [Chloroflexus sp.]MDW8405237.1 aminoglycoside phosphotransferase family protein [Chloroflexus sp.]